MYVFALFLSIFVEHIYTHFQVSQDKVVYRKIIVPVCIVSTKNCQHGKFLYIIQIAREVIRLKTEED